MELKAIRNDLPGLINKLKQLPARLSREGNQWIEESVEDMRMTLLEHLASQGRGGTPPPLSDMTTHLYSQVGVPDGSGIRDHIRAGASHIDNTSSGYVGILAGQPTIVAKVQDEGAIIPVTDKMRGYLAIHGIFLKATTTHIVVPGRHFWTDSLTSVKGRAKKRLRKLWREVWRSLPN